MNKFKPSIRVGLFQGQKICTINFKSFHITPRLATWLLYSTRCPFNHTLRFPYCCKCLNQVPTGGTRLQSLMVWFQTMFGALSISLSVPGFHKALPLVARYPFNLKNYTLIVYIDTYICISIFITNESYI